MVRPSEALGGRLDALARRYDRRWLESDPLRWPRAYADPEDREVVAVVAALLAYGRVASIQRSIADVLSRLPTRPSEAVRPGGGTATQARLRGFRHRFTTGEDLAWVLESVARAREERGSLGAFVGAAAGGSEPLRTGLAAWRSLAWAVPASRDPARRRARAHLLPDPAAGGACKRTLLLARWCVRPDDGLDLGLWKDVGLRPRDLLLPLDTHVHRVVRQLGLTSRRAADWRAAAEATASLARYDPDDPVRFDFALARPGIVGLCRHRHVPEICGACDLRPDCAFGTPRGRLGRSPTRRTRTSARSP
jgi:uncharacterized protein (TIGR02757 family)